MSRELWRTTQCVARATFQGLPFYMGKSCVFNAFSEFFDYDVLLYEKVMFSVDFTKFYGLL